MLVPYDVIYIVSPDDQSTLQMQNKKVRREKERESEEKEDRESVVWWWCLMCVHACVCARVDASVYAVANGQQFGLDSEISV